LLLTINQSRKTAAGFQDIY